MIRSATCAVALMLGLAACGPEPEAAAAADAPATEGVASAIAPARIEAVKAQVLALVTADEDCTLREGMERTVETVDLGGGDVGALVVCSTGMTDLWSRVYVAEGEAAPVLARLPVYKFQGMEDWRSLDSMSNMTVQPDKSFAGSAILQATGCTDAATWRWDGTRMLLATQSHMDCKAIGPNGELPDPIQDFPTTPPTPQPEVIEAAY